MVFAFVLVFFNVFLFGALRVLVTLQALKLGAQPLTVGMLAAAFALCPMLLSLHAGRITDRYGARWPVVFGVTASAASLLLAYFVPSLTVMFIAAVVCGLGVMLYALSTQILVGALSTPESRARNYSNTSMVVSLASAVGPAFAGFSIDHAGAALTFLYIAGMLQIPVVLLLVWGRKLPGGRTHPESAHRVWDILRSTRLWPVLLASALSQCGLEVFQVYLPVYADAHGLSASAIGLILAISAAGGFLARILLTRLIAWWGDEKVIAYALFVGAISFLLVPLFEGASALSVIAFVFGFGLNCSQPLTLTLIYGRSPRGRAGEALGVRFALDNAAKLVGPVAFGVIASAFGVGAVFWINGLLLGGGGVFSRHDSGRNGGKHEQRVN